jgi:hypothetical protein
MIGIFRRCASRTPISSVFRSTMKIASGGRCRLREVDRQLLALVHRGDALTGRQQVERAVLDPLVEVVQPLDPLGDRLEVGEQATEPALVDVRHAGALGRFLDRVAGLLLGTDEHDGAAARGDAGGELLSTLQQLVRLLQVDDVDPAALAVDEAAHLGIPAARLVTEVDAGLQQLPDADFGHRNYSLVVVVV